VGDRARVISRVFEGDLEESGDVVQGLQVVSRVDLFSAAGRTNGIGP
jgi:hypothetical protein